MAAREWTWGKGVQVFTFMALMFALLLGGFAAFAPLTQGAYHGIRLDQSVPPLSLRDHRGQVFTDQNLQGTYSYVVFGYLHCPDVCPRQLQLLKEVAASLPGDAGVRFLWISLDPDEQRQDVVELLGSDPRFLPLWGESPEVLQGVATAFNNQVVYHREKDLSDYISHGEYIYMLNPAGRLALVYSIPAISAALLVADYERLKREDFK